MGGQRRDPGEAGTDDALNRQLPEPTTPEQTSNRDETPGARRSDGRPPMPRDKRGWHVAPAPDGRGMPEQTPTGPPAHRTRGFLWFVLALITLNWISVLFLQPSTGEQRVQIPFNPSFLDDTQAGHVKSISSKGDTIEGTFTIKVRFPHTDAKATPTKLFATQVPTFWNGIQLAALLKEKHVEINAKSTTTSESLLEELLLGFGPTLLIVGLFVLLARRAAGGGGMGALGNFGRSQARRVDPEKIRVTFDDVAGIDEAKAELTEIVDFLRNPDRYGRLGGRMPHGVLLSGAPGTGKTLLARAVAGEAHAAFFSISASEFIEAIVGVGASRVRDLFAKAKEAAPAIIFIDELDAIGRSRQGSVSVTGANDEREQTLDQILTEIDGFESAEAVVVLAATNRPDVLDPALLRAGRFDRRVVVQAPDRTGRVEILKVHTRSIPLGPERRPGSDRVEHARAWSAPISPTSPTRRRCWPRGANTRRSRCATSPTRWRRSCSALRAGSCSCRPIASAPPTTRPAMRWSACSRRAPTPCARSRSSPAGWRSG